ncbi:hypothetical protein Ddc_24868 [Ditylenchus destructor]|nr:hypothetical protein Ddc_24868 [Ditylenchus destructor]
MGIFRNGSSKSTRADDDHQDGPALLTFDEVRTIRSAQMVFSTELAAPLFLEAFQTTIKIHGAFPYLE